MSAILVVLMYTTSTGSFYARFDALGNEYKRIALGLSESCSHAALLKVAQKYTYDVTTDTGYVAGKGVPVTVGPDTCFIQSVAYGAEDPVTHQKVATIYTNAQFPAASGSWSTTKISATVRDPADSVTTPSPISIGSWDEVIRVVP